MLFPVEQCGRAFGPGDRIRIRAVRDVGSARLLHGLAGEVVGPHPLAPNWYKIRLDPNDISPHPEWSAPLDRLIPEDIAADTQSPQTGQLLEQITVRHWP